ncbi:hypothetical protein SAMD00020551_3096 [Mesobacillus selenatarsenatis SF-1]|uniref:Uncharacterized protein n=1 Tax=Mesobacillus selenatarsenatis (strain DSM 18680 / JCM 14380 / FERM P-15431 / SF-1) TaxID=1321606 RepID=A0A0A8X4R2_MESS1|nr:hypothetical protein SAMD00020551_3096 [Mesobacillus selenatarsenatis SF-1]
MLESLFIFRVKYKSLHINHPFFGRRSIGIGLPKLIHY